jgi:hypothetical protein
MRLLLPARRKCPQPTQGAPKKKKEGKSVGCSLGLFFWSFFVFVFGGPSPQGGQGRCCKLTHYTHAWQFKFKALFCFKKPASFWF